MDIDKTLADLKGQHDALTSAYQTAKDAGTRAEYAEAKAAVTEFRAKYGKILKALDEVAATGKTEVSA